MMTSGIGMQALSDELEIRNLIARLAHLADDGTLDDYVACMTDDTRWEMRPVPGLEGTTTAMPARRGHADIRAAAQARRASGLQGPGTRSRHMVTTTVVTVSGDTAAATSCVIFVHHADGQQKIDFAGVYNDAFVRALQGWRLSQRVVTPI